MRPRTPCPLSSGSCLGTGSRSPAVSTGHTLSLQRPLPRSLMPTFLCSSSMDTALTTQKSTAPLLSCKCKRCPKCSLRDILNVDVSGRQSQSQATQTHTDLKWSTMGQQAQARGGEASLRRAHRVVTAACSVCFLAIFYTAAILGPAAGYLIGGAMLNVYTEVGQR